MHTISRSIIQAPSSACATVHAGTINNCTFNPTKEIPGQECIETPFAIFFHRVVTCSPIKSLIRTPHVNGEEEEKGQRIH